MVMEKSKELAQRIADKRYSIDGSLARALVGKVADVTFAKVQAKAYALAVFDMADYLDHAKECGVNQPHGTYRFAQGCDCGFDDLFDPA